MHMYVHVCVCVCGGVLWKAVFLLFICCFVGVGIFGGFLEDCEWSVGQMIKYKSEL